MTIAEILSENPRIELYQGDCLEVMKQFEDKRFDLCLTDMPYGITACEWDKPVDLEVLWKLLKPIHKDNAVYVFTASQPFTTDLINSNRKRFKYEWIWDKKIHGNFLLAKFQPMKIHENILIFGKRKYNPQMTKGKLRLTGGGKSKLWNMDMTKRWNNNYYPQSIIDISNTKRGRHPTQKPIALMQYLIRTYSNEGDTIIDMFAGSGSTGIAAYKLNRNCVMIEKEPKYCEIIRTRFLNMPLRLFAREESEDIKNYGKQCSINFEM